MYALYAALCNLATIVSQYGVVDLESVANDTFLVLDIRSDPVYIYVK